MQNLVGQPTNRKRIPAEAESSGPVERLAAELAAEFKPLGLLAGPLGAGLARVIAERVAPPSYVVAEGALRRVALRALRDGARGGRDGARGKVVVRADDLEAFLARHALSTGADHKAAGPDEADVLLEDALAAPAKPRRRRARGAR